MFQEKFYFQQETIKLSHSIVQTNIRNSQYANSNEIKPQNCCIADIVRNA